MRVRESGGGGISLIGHEQWQGVTTVTSAVCVPQL